LSSNARVVHDKNLNRKFKKDIKTNLKNLKEKVAVNMNILFLGAEQ
jgi:hypothetical protein